MSSITGTWTSYRQETPAGSKSYSGQETMTLYSDGTGIIKRKALLFRKIRLRWQKDSWSGLYEIYADSGELLYQAALVSDNTLEAGWASVDPLFYRTIFVK